MFCSKPFKPELVLVLSDRKTNQRIQKLVLAVGGTVFPYLFGVKCMVSRMSGCFWNCQAGPVVWVAFRPPKGLLIWFRIGNTSLNPSLTEFPVECKFGGAGLTTTSLTKLQIWGSATLHWLESPGFRVRSMSKEEMGNITSRPLLTVWKDTEQCCWVVRHNIGPNHACFLCISCDRTPRDGYCRTP